ncbi:MAG TPA: RNA polymerase sigma factor [Thermoanaerobaculia bacterium]|nr:RNA polymerase sigma factor [Thermoanaerobaculia bacterium]
MDDLAPLVERARAGDAAALEQLVTAIQDDVYGLALRMLWHPDDAADAAQEILIRIVTHLSDFRGESRFRSWCYAIAANHLRTVRRGRMESADLTFETFERELHETASAAEDLESNPEYAVAVEEVRVGCTLGMLLCLDREQRLAYIAGEILELDHHEAAEILGISPAAFRQRLARARKAIVGFTSRVCGIVDPANGCHCTKRVAYAIERGRVHLGKPVFGDCLRTTAPKFAQVQNAVRRLEELRRAAALYRSHPRFTPRTDLAPAAIARRR